MKQKGLGALPIIVTVLAIILLGLGFLVIQSFLNKKAPDAQMSKFDDPKMQEEGVKKASFEKLTEPKLLFKGGYADPTITTISDGKLVMYMNNFSSQPAKYQAYTSDDGMDWQLASAKLPNASTGRAVKMDGKIRLYYPDRTPIKPSDPPASVLSAISADGFNFTNESGTRVDPLNDKYYLEGPTVFTLKNGKYRMYFSENEAASAEKRISVIWGATSSDGLTWTRDQYATIEADEQVEKIPPDWPQALHPFVLTRPDGSYLMFYNTHSEVFAATSSDGINWTKLGAVGIHGADVDGYYLPDGSIRLYYGDFSPQLQGVVYTIDIKEEN